MSALTLGMLLLAGAALAGPREQARRIHDRIAGVPPDQATLTAMETDITNGNPVAAAMRAIENPAFYNVTLKNWITPWTNEEQTVFAPLNDYTATVIGIIRDSVDFREILSGDILYVGNASLGLPPYAMNNNAHYEALETQHIDLKANLVRVTQSSVTGLPASATAGVLTTRAAAKAFFSGGTNRAMFRFTFINHLCTDLEPLKDTTRPPDRIRQDVSRSPGGDSRIFLNNCVGCHAGMDPMAQAFAYYEYQYDMANDPEGDNGQLVYNDVGMMDPATGTRVQAKYHINSSNFKPGYVTPDDHWDNYWRKGPNQRLGWSSTLPGSGDGAKTLGEELANSDAFAQCQVTKVFQAMCLRPPQDANDRAEVATLVNNFKTNGYDLKQIFAQSAVYCMGD
jgi:hypothetical protein